MVGGRSGTGDTGGGAGPCALCGAPAVEVVAVGLRDRRVRAALCDPHRTALGAALEPVLAAGVPEGADGHDHAVEAGTGGPRADAPPAYPRLLPGEDREAIRAWAVAAGLPVARTGTLSAAVLARYRAAAAAASVPAPRAAAESGPLEALAGGAVAPWGAGTAPA